MMTEEQKATVEKIKAKKAGKGKPVVRGPQLALPAKPAARMRTAKPAKGEPPRTARVRYIEPPTKKEGNPFVAVRMPRELHAEFVKWCKSRGGVPSVLRAYASKVTGVKLTEGEDGGADE